MREVSGQETKKLELLCLEIALLMHFDTFYDLNVSSNSKFTCELHYFNYALVIIIVAEACLS